MSIIRNEKKNNEDTSEEENKNSHRQKRQITIITLNCCGNKYVNLSKQPGSIRQGEYSNGEAKKK